MKRILLQTGAIFLPIGIWAAAAAIVDLPVILPGPVTVLSGALEVITGPGFFLQVAATTVRTSGALAVAILIAVPAGIIAGRHEPVSILLSPMATVLRSTPVISLILLALIWFRSGGVPVFVAILMTAPILYDAARSGSGECPDELLEMAGVFHVGTFRRYREIVVPASLPALFAGLRSAHGIAWKVTVAAEVLSQPVFGIGSQLNQARIYLLTELVLAWTVILVIFSTIGDRLIHRAEQGFRRRRGIDE